MRSTTIPAKNFATTDHLPLRTRYFLIAGFGGQLALLAVAGIYGIGVLQQIRRSDRQTRSEFLAQNRTLSDLDSQIYLSGTYLRDYLLDPTPENAEFYRSSLTRLRCEMNAAILMARGQFEPSQNTHLRELSVELAQYWQTLEPTFQWDTDQRHRQGYVFLRDQIFPQRQSLLSVADRIARLDEQQLNAGNQQVDLLLARARARLTLCLAATLLLDLGVSASSIMIIMRLEDCAQSRFEEVVGIRKDLEALSIRLVHAQENERRSPSRELHDDVGQHLSAILIELHNLSGAAAIHSDAKACAQIENVKNLVENSASVVRNLALLLRPSMLDDLGLIPALRWQARDVSKRTGMEVSLRTELADDDLPDDYKTCIFRIVQETLQNCSRHSHATRVEIIIQQDSARLQLSIHDDGVGFDPSQTKGLGLLGVEERVAALGGTCRIRSLPGAGVNIRVEFQTAREGYPPLTDIDTN